MRLPGWVFIAGAFLLVAGTALCSILAFVAARENAIEMAANGLEPKSLPELAQFMLGNGQAVTPQQPGLDESTLPSPTAVPTLGAIAATATLPASGASTTPSLVGPTPTDDLAPGPIDPRRKTILLMGIDQREGVIADGPPRTDTLILVSVDPVRKTAGVLSIPRDLWVDIPGTPVVDRINTAYAIGEANAYPGGGGPALAAETVQQLIGMRVDNYVVVNFHAFTAIANLIAPQGVEICVRELIDDPKYPDAGLGTIHVHFDPGCQNLDAEHLLQYARTRATFGGDFDRARRQQEVLDTLRAHVLSAGGIGSFVAQAPAIWDELKDSYRTNLGLDEVVQLGRLMSDIPRENIHFGVIDNRFVDLGSTAQGDKILIPRQNAIVELVQQTFNPETDLTLADLRTRAEAENARIAVYNNTDIAGLARETSEWLASRQVDVATVGNMPTTNNADTVIRDYTGSPWTARYLAALLNLPETRIESGGDGLTSLDVMVVVGPDIQPLLNGQ